MSQIATTIEQSKRLLDAGIDPGSSDMSWVAIDTPWRKESKTENVLTVDNPVPHRSTPAWSLSRLIDLIAETGVPMNYGLMKDSASVLDHAVNALEYQLLHANH